MEINNFVVVGMGELPFKCALSLIQNKANVIYIESKKLNYNNFQYKCEINGIKYLEMSEQANDYLHNLQSNTMIISASNPYIFDQTTLLQKNVIAINYHNSLLPLHKGVNAEAWAIYKQDELTGVTWHIIYPKIDIGPIIYQEELTILPDETSLELLSRQAKIAYRIFNNNIEDIIDCKFSLKEQKGKSSYHSIKDIPNKGFFNIEWDIKKAYSFLRAMDYGHLRTLGFPKIMLNNTLYTWHNYTLINNNNELRGKFITNDGILLNYNKYQIKLNKIKQLSNT